MRNRKLVVGGAILFGTVQILVAACATEGEDGLPGKMGEMGEMGSAGPVGPPGPSTNAPAGAIMFFDSNCPTGWTEYLPLRGRVPVGATTTVGTSIGTQLADSGTRTITQVPTHTHTVDPPNTTATAAGSHTHDTDPGPFGSSVDGNHTHSVFLGQGDDGNNNNFKPFYARSGNVGTGFSNAAGAHGHTIDVPNTTSSAAGVHAHDVDVAPFNSAASGVASVDVTMPYMQLRACRKD